MAAIAPTSRGLRRRRVGKVFEALCFAATLVGSGILLIILGYITKKGVGAINVDFFIHVPKPTGEVGGGVSNAILGTGIMVGIAACVAIPIGVLAGTYLAEFGRGRFAYIVRLLADVMMGIPSIVVGILAYQLIVIRMGHFSAWAGGIALAVLMLPTIVRASEEILRLVPREYTEASLALGIPRWRTILTIVYPSAMGGLVTGIMLALARASGETAPLLFTALGNQLWNTHPNEPMAALPLQIYTYAISPYADLHRQAWAAALVLVTLVLIFSAVARLATRSKGTAG